MTLETNIRVVSPGPQLYVMVRRVQVSGQNSDRDILERACSRLRLQHRLAAAPEPGGCRTLLVATERQVPTFTLNDSDWEIQAEDSDRPPLKLHFGDCPDLVTVLVERALLVEVGARSTLWSLGSPRIWYEQRPFKTAGGISAFRRYELGTLPIEGVGVGIIADVGTAFFSASSLDFFFEPNLSEREKALRLGTFQELSGRQQGQKGTLLYDNGRSKTTCYFEDAPEGLTCHNTGRLMVRGRAYDSLHEYYKDNYPHLEVEKDSQAVRVSFRGLERPQPVAAHLLRPRIMNDNVPRELSSVDKIAPKERRSEITKFWDSLGPLPIGKVAPGLHPGFWRPQQEKVYHFDPPITEFGAARTIPGLASRDVQSLRNYYASRMRLLEGGHCYRFPPAATRTIHVAHPEYLEGAAGQISDDIARTLMKWTGKQFQYNLVGYNNASEAYDVLRRQEEGIVLFVLDSEPAAYYETSYNLPGWRIKRITEATLKNQMDYLSGGAWDRSRKRKTREAGKRRWDSFVSLNALDVLQLLDAVPYRTKDLGAYEGQLVIDVGYDRKFFAVSLLISRDSGSLPNFGVYTAVHHKEDHKKEIINPVLLNDAIVELLQMAMARSREALGSLLIMRDGRIQEAEISGIDKALDSLRHKGILDDGARVDIVGFHKTSLKNVRLWALNDGQVSNPLEGTGLSLNSNTFVLCSTGAATLTQGTAEPLTLVGTECCHSLQEAGLSAFASAQLNWSSPRVAQRLPLPLKRTDDELSARLAQEIRRIR